MSENTEKNSTKAGFVAIIGKPNAGKSTLMNAVIGEKLSIVTPKPQTTRKKVLGIYSTDDVQIVFVDTPGILKPRYEMHSAMMGYVDEALDSCDVIMALVDLEKYDEHKPYFHISTMRSMKDSGKPVILVLNKIDTFANKRDVLPIMARFMAEGIFTEVIPMSALENDNVEPLLEVIGKYLPENEFYYDPELISTQPQRFFVSEIIREHVFKNYEQELPYSTEVNVVEFKERENGKWYIHAEIVVERDTQKRIVIGEKGSGIKSLSESSRIAIEQHLDMEIYLELFVKVREKWRNNKNMLRGFGY
eukprot:TRINITY_DN12101_c0_g1_i1.p1 TRINITY_DN12101_c0_g1~~TRINITY_DN12101_c0_g1_i1.p1  ORF type:complete len:305 (-),score=-25.89 TRINITY_DN12101_c0_g1_i1:28-942(-)